MCNVDLYLERFFEKKHIPEKTFELTDSENRAHIINVEAIKEFILDSDLQIKTQIAAKLMQLNFNNQPIMPFLEYIAEYIIDQ